MRRMNCGRAVFAFFLAAGMCAAQDDAVGKRQAAQGGRGGGRQFQGLRNPRTSNPQQMLVRLNEVLQLDDTQKQAIEKVFQDQEAKQEELRNSTRLSPEAIAKMKQVRDELKAAHGEGDQEKVTKLMDEMKAWRDAREEQLIPYRQHMEKSHAELHDAIAAVLRADQKEKFEGLWKEEFSRDGRGRGRGRLMDPQVLKTMVDRLDDISATQKQQIEQLFTAFAEASRNPDKQPSAEVPGNVQRTSMTSNQRKLQFKLYEDVMAVLTPPQKERLEKELAERDAKAARGPRPHGAEGGQEGTPGTNP